MLSAATPSRRHTPYFWDSCTVIERGATILAALPRPLCLLCVSWVQQHQGATALPSFEIVAQSQRAGTPSWHHCPDLCVCCTFAECSNTKDPTAIPICEVPAQSPRAETPRRHHTPYHPVSCTITESWNNNQAAVVCVCVCVLIVRKCRHLKPTTPLHLCVCCCTHTSHPSNAAVLPPAQVCASAWHQCLAACGLRMFMSCAAVCSMQGR